MLTKPWKYIFNFWKKRSALCRRSKKYLGNFFRKWLATNILKNKDKKIDECYTYEDNADFRNDIRPQFKLYILPKIHQYLREVN